MNDIYEYIIRAGALVGACGAIMGVLIHWWTKFYLKPRQLQEEKMRYERMIEADERMRVTLEPINQTLASLNQSITDLRDELKDSKTDRHQLNKVADETTIRLGKLSDEVGDHDKRITVLEHHNRIQEVK